MKNKELQYFLKIAEVGSMTLAAEQLRITQPAISLAIKNLEKSIGLPLFSRTGRRVTLTKAGLLYADYARKLVKQSEVLRQNIEQLRNDQKESMRVGIHRSYPPRINAQIITNFTKKYPNIQFSWLEGTYKELENFLISEEVDLFFSLYPYLRNEFSYHEISLDEMVLITAKGHPVGKYSKKHPSFDNALWMDLKNMKKERFLTYPLTFSNREYIDLFLAELKVQFDNTFIVHSIDTMLELVKNSFGFALISKRFVERYEIGPYVDMYYFENAPKNTTFGAIWLKDKGLPPYGQDVLDMIQKEEEKLAERKIAKLTKQ